MRHRENIFNPKRQILASERWSAELGRRIADDAGYGGNPEHKTRPGDYDLTPPCNPRPGKTLCDAERIFSREEALILLRQGFERGLVSVQTRNRWPQNVWAVSESGMAFEAQLENQAAGTYHGYPMPEDDDFRSKVIEEWRRRDPQIHH